MYVNLVYKVVIIFTIGIKNYLKDWLFKKKKKEKKIWVPMAIKPI